MKNNRFLITTTNNVEGCRIIQYIDTICANVVVGTNIFSDIAATLSDFFGGFSGSYKSKLELIYETATKELKQKANQIGANAIIGFNIDFDEISGGGKSMFMVSVSGTACILEYPKVIEENTISSNIITQESLDLEIKKQYIVKSIKSGKALRSDWIEFLYENPQNSIVEKLIDEYIRYYQADAVVKNFVEKYLTLLEPADIFNDVYSKYVENPNAIGELIGISNLFSPLHIMNLFKTDIHLAIRLFNTKKNYYTKEDLDHMNEILQMADSLPDTGKIEMVESGFFNKTMEQKFICEHGHRNDKEQTYCSCGINIKGLNYDEIEKIEGLRTRTQVLSEMLK